MSNRPEWFVPKRYGVGAGLPIAWQGWVILILFVGISLAAGVLVGDRPLIFFSILVPTMALFMIIVARTTKGGWRWRWGDKE